MSTMVLSDLHFGESRSLLYHQAPGGRGIREIDNLVNYIRTRQIQSLVLAGDVFDFSLATYKDAFENAAIFFQKIADNPTLENIIYIPGNHDKNVFDLMMEHYAVTFQVGLGSAPKDVVPRSAMVHLDARSGKGFLGYDMKEDDPYKKGLDTITPEKCFLAGLMRQNGKTPNRPKIIVAYPNLYVTTDRGVYLVTHGHFFQVPWSIVSFLWTKTLNAIGENPKPGDPEFLTLEEIEAVNSPITKMIWTSMGQVPELRQIMGNIYDEITRKESSLDGIDRLIEEAAKSFDDKWYVQKSGKIKHRFAEFNSDVAIRGIQYLAQKVIHYLVGMASSKHEREVFRDPVNQWLADRYLEASAYHFEKHLNAKPAGNFPVVIFGHTHFEDERAPVPADWETGGRIEFKNCGGWIRPEENSPDRNKQVPRSFILHGDGTIESDLVKNAG